MVVGDGERMETEEGAEAGQQDGPPKVYVPGRSRPLRPGEQWDYDPNAYRLFHEFSAEHPCLSFDPLPDAGGLDRTDYPAHCSLVCGTQAARPRDNQVCLMRLLNLTKTKHDSDESGSSSSDSDSEAESAAADEDAVDGSGRKPRVIAARIAHHGGVNRIRARRMAEHSAVCAVWNDAGKVQIWNLANCMRAVDEAAEADREAVAKRRLRRIDMKNEKPLHTFAGHLSEGFAVDWSPVKLGLLSSGDNKGRIHVWHMAEGGVWHVDQRPYTRGGGGASVEDLQWSPVEEAVLCSVSSDSSLVLWDTRAAPSSSECAAVTVASAHGGRDANVCSWSAHQGGSLVLSGGDDGALNVWDLKAIRGGEPVATFGHHKAPITSVHWCPAEGDATVFAAASEDNQTTLWDLSVESDTAGGGGDDADGQGAESSVPPQLMFVHMGQDQVKEVRFHPNLRNTTITTAADGFNIFRTISV